MGLKYIGLCFALTFLVEVQSCDGPCDKYPTATTCSLIQSVDNSTVGIILLTPPANQSKLQINAYTPCTYHNVRTAWNIVVVNSAAVIINGIFEPLFPQIHLTLMNVSDLIITAGAFRYVTFVMSLEFVDANSTISFQPGAFFGCRGTIIVRQPAGGKVLNFSNDSFTNSVVHIRSVRSGNSEYIGDKTKPNPLLPSPSSGFCDTLASDKQKAVLTNSEFETRILPYITLGCVILVLAFCIAITVSIILNGRASEKYVPSVKFMKKAKEPRIANSNNLNASTAGLPSMSKSPLLPPRNPGTERTLPRPPISIVNSSNR